MKNQVNQRILEVKDALDLSEREFCSVTEMSTGTLHRIKNDLGISGKTLNSIIVKLNLNREWLKNGSGEMFNPSPGIETSASKTFSEKTIEALERHIDTLERNNRVLLDTLNKLMQKVEVNFRDGIADLAGITKCNSCNTVRVAA
jgi:predicted RNase H-like nuclease (RuvC/YqgF family)